MQGAHPRRSVDDEGSERTAVGVDIVTVIPIVDCAEYHLEDIPLRGLGVDNVPRLSLALCLKSQECKVRTLIDPGRSLAYRAESYPQDHCRNG